MPFKNAVAELQPEIAAWRQALHSDPELLFGLMRLSQVWGALGWLV